MFPQGTLSDIPPDNSYIHTKSSLKSSQIDHLSEQAVINDSFYRSVTSIERSQLSVQERLKLICMVDTMMEIELNAPDKLRNTSETSKSEKTNVALTGKEKKEESSPKVSSSSKTSSPSSPNDVMSSNQKRILSRLERKQQRAAATTKSKSRKSKEVRIQVYTVDAPIEDAPIVETKNVKNEKENDTSTVMTAATAALTEVSSFLDDSFQNSFSASLNDSHTSQDSGNTSTNLYTFMDMFRGEETSKQKSTPNDGVEVQVDAKGTTRINGAAWESFPATPMEDPKKDYVSFEDQKQETKGEDSTNPSGEIVTEMGKIIHAADSWMTSALNQTSQALNQMAASPPKSTTHHTASSSSEKPDQDLNALLVSPALDHISPMARLRMERPPNNNITHRNHPITNPPTVQVNDVNGGPPFTVGSFESHDSEATEITKNILSSPNVLSISHTYSSNISPSISKESTQSNLSPNKENKDDSDLLEQLGINNLVQMFSSECGPTQVTIPNLSEFFPDPPPEYASRYHDDDSYYDDDESTFYDDDTTHASTISEGSEDSDPSMYSTHSGKGNVSSEEVKHEEEPSRETIAKPLLANNPISTQKPISTPAIPPPPPNTVYSQKNSPQKPPSSDNNNNKTPSKKRMHVKKQEDYMNDPQFVQTFIEELLQKGVTLTWHQAQTSQYYQRPKSLNVTLTLDSQTPKFLLTSSNNFTLDLFDILSFEHAQDVNFHSYPFAIPSNSFFVSVSQDRKMLLEAKDPNEKQRIVYGLEQLIAKLSHDLIAGEIDLCWDLCSNHPPKEEEVCPDFFTKEEMELWFVSQVMNDVTHRLVQKSTLQAQRVEEVTI